MKRISIVVMTPTAVARVQSGCEEILRAHVFAFADIRMSPDERSD